MATANASRVERLRAGVEMIRRLKRSQHRMDEWFRVQQIKMEQQEAMRAAGLKLSRPAWEAELLCRVVERIPLSIVPGSAIAGTQDGAFSASYALINPAFKVEGFTGYCDPTAIYHDIEPDPAHGITREAIEEVGQYWGRTEFVRRLGQVYARTGDETREVVYFVEPVTGHTIPDLRPYLRCGVQALQETARAQGTPYGEAMARALDAALILARRYQTLAEEQAARTRDEQERERLQRIATLLQQVPARGAATLHEAVQAFCLLWQVMVLEQGPNPYAFSVGNLDRILAPYYDVKEASREEAVALVRHLLCFFQVGDRCWAISQNIIVGGKDATGRDLSNEMTYIVLDAFFETNDPQPALSAKVHQGTPGRLYQALGRFFFTPGHSTPSIFNDDVLFELLRRQGVAEEDLPDCSIAGCQEPLIMGKSSLNTTNTWLNLGKILELACNDGISLISGKRIAPSWAELGFTQEQAYAHLEEVFWKLLDWVLPRMQEAGNACTTLLGREKPVPFTSALMEGLGSGRDMRDPEQPGVRYHGSGCLIHGLSVVADSLQAVKATLTAGVCSAADIRAALQQDFEGHKAQQDLLIRQDKFGNNHSDVDGIAVRLVEGVSRRIAALKNAAGNSYLADFSTPSTHLLYGYWVGATPDGRKARTMLGYGVDPRAESTPSELPRRIVSTWKLPFLRMTGGYASHIGLTPSVTRHLSADEDKGMWMRDNIVKPLFRLGDGVAEAPYYVYFNIDSAEHLRQVLREPKKHAPSGIYIMRIHGTFVNFLDLSPAIQEDIITRLEAGGRSA